MNGIIADRLASDLGMNGIIAEALARDLGMVGAAAGSDPLRLLHLGRKPPAQCVLRHHPRVEE